MRSGESRGRRILHATHLAAQIRACTGGCCAGGGPGTLEQRRRHGGVVDRVDGTTAYSPIWDWSDSHVLTYLARRQIPSNPIYARLTRLGAPAHATRVSHLIDANGLEAGRVRWRARDDPGKAALGLVVA